MWWSESQHKHGCVKMYLVQCPSLNIKEVVHKFAEPGHSYLQNDSDFGDIEKKL